MAYSKIEKMVTEMATPIAVANSCYIYDAEYVKEGGAWYLRVYADKEDGGISIDECEVINRALGDELDKADTIRENYILEVSSPGIERKLKTPEHFKKYIGRIVDIGLYKASDGSKTLMGELTGYEDDGFTVKIGQNETKLAVSDTTFVKLHFDF